MQRKKPLTIAVALVMGVLVGTFVLTPAGAHMGNKVGHLWKKHIRPKSDGRYLHMVETVQSEVVTVPADTSEGATASCPEGKIAVGGGFGSVGFDQPMQVARSAPEPSGSAWRIVVRNPGTGDGTILAFAVCAAGG
jgi:hypothetical protein